MPFLFQRNTAYIYVPHVVLTDNRLHCPAAVYLFYVQLGLAEDMKRTIITVECERVKQIDPGLRLIIMSRQASGARGGGKMYTEWWNVWSVCVTSVQLTVYVHVRNHIVTPLNSSGSVLDLMRVLTEVCPS